MEKKKRKGFALFVGAISSANQPQQLIFPPPSPFSIDILPPITNYLSSSFLFLGFWLRSEASGYQLEFR